MSGHGDTVPVVKFPRTSHALDAGGGAVTRDDLLMSAADAASCFVGPVVTVEEKVDGAFGRSCSPWRGCMRIVDIATDF